MELNEKRPVGEEQDGKRKQGGTRKKGIMRGNEKRMLSRVAREAKEDRPLATVPRVLYSSSKRGIKCTNRSVTFALRFHR